MTVWCGQRLEHVAPVLGADRDAVDQQQHRSFAAAEVADLAAVQFRRLEADLARSGDVRAIGHAPTVARPRAADARESAAASNTVAADERAEPGFAPAPRGSDRRRRRPPRRVVAALLATDKASGEAADLEWVQRVPMADSRSRSPLPGGGAMQLIDGSIRTPGINVSGYSLFRVSSRAADRRRRPVGGGRILCSVSGAGGRKSPRARGGLRATYPRSTPDSSTRKCRKRSCSNSARTEPNSPCWSWTAAAHFSNEKGVKLEWPKYEPGTEHLEYSSPTASRSRTSCCPSTRSGGRPRFLAPRSPARSPPAPVRRPCAPAS